MHYIDKPKKKENMLEDDLLQHIDYVEKGEEGRGKKTGQAGRGRALGGERPMAPPPTEDEGSREGQGEVGRGEWVPPPPFHTAAQPGVMPPPPPSGVVSHTPTGPVSQAWGTGTPRARSGA